MIPIVLEAAAMNDQEVVEDWALDAPSQKLLLSHNAAKKGNSQEATDRQLGTLLAHGSRDPYNVDVIAVLDV